MLKKLTSAITLSLLLFNSYHAYSQALSNKTGSWNILTLVLPGSAEHRWGGYAESQVRTDEVLNKFFYYELKAGASYNFDNNSSVLLGTGRYTTYDYLDLDKGPVTTETRLWEQFTFVQFVGRVKFEHRYRIEQRFLNTGYQNRFRYRINPIIPINKPKIQPNTLFLSVFDEIFLNNKQPHFERNRVSAALGFQFTKALSAQAGWVNQYNNGMTSTNKKNNLMLILMYQIQRKKSEPDLPTLRD